MLGRRRREDERSPSRNELLLGVIFARKKLSLHLIPSLYNNLELDTFTVPILAFPKL
jgi:hypothetical protein